LIYTLIIARKLDTERQTFWIPCVIWGLSREVDLNCDLLGYYASSSGNFLPTFRDNLSFPYSKLPLLAGSLRSG